METLRGLFGLNGEELNLTQFLLRTLVIYLVGIALVHLGKSRFLGKLTAFDAILAIVLGSMLSRAVSQAEYFIETLLACLLLVLLHWLFSRIAAYSDSFGAIFKGSPRQLVRDGVLDETALKQSHLSKTDLLQALRLNAHTEDLGHVKHAYLERNGDISLVLRQPVAD